MNLSYINDVNGALSRLCTKVDPGWAATLGITNNPQMPHVVGITSGQSGNGLASYILDNPYSFGVLLPISVRTPTAQLINQAGKAVTVSPATVSQAFLELAANGPLADGSGFDLSNAQSAYAWPMSVTRPHLSKADALSLPTDSAHCCPFCVLEFVFFFLSFFLVFVSPPCAGAWARGC